MFKQYISRGERFYDSIIKCIQNIEADESIDHIVQDWNFCRDRYHPPHEFEILISKTAGDMGRDLIDSSKMCKNFIMTGTRR